MKILPIEKFIIYSIITITLFFSGIMLKDHLIYKDATSDIKNGEYQEAAISLEKLGDYRDAKTLKEYCEIMNEYDSQDFNSIYHCYRELTELDLDNNALRDVFTKTSTEIETLYKYYDVSLSTK